VGVEPTTSASTVSILVPSAVIGKKIVQIPPAPLSYPMSPLHRISRRTLKSLNLQF
jgi:hypothetical protein